MNNLSNWVQNLTRKVSSSFRTFMIGRYGIDRLNMVILYVSLGAVILFSFLGETPVGMIAGLISYALAILAIFRSLSRNTHKRYQENRRFLLLLDRFRDRQNRYFICPGCHQTVRVPRHKGKIAITCPKCKKRFERRT